MYNNDKGTIVLDNAKVFASLIKAVIEMKRLPAHYRSESGANKWILDSWKVFMSLLPEDREAETRYIYYMYGSLLRIFDERYGTRLEKYVEQHYSYQDIINDIR